jgi:Activator of Hsp90 ATPase homolog 1-like protein
MDFTTTLLVDQSPTEVFNAINNVRGWWQGEITGNTTGLHDEFTYQMADFHITRQKIVALVPDEKIEWLVTESSINFIADKNAWLNTIIRFEIDTVGDQTRLTFTHHGLVPAVACYGACSDGWSQLIHKSLWSLITVGKGVEVF